MKNTLVYMLKCDILALTMKFAKQHSTVRQFATLPAISITDQSNISIQLAVQCHHKQLSMLTQTYY
jgi:hypothetical protein